MNPPPTTINEILMAAVRRFADSTAFGRKQYGRWVEVSYAETLRRVRAIALGLHHIGIRKSDHVLLLAENSLEWILSDLGILMCGAIDVPIYHNLTAEQVRYIVRDSEAKVAFVSNRKQLAKLDGLQSEATPLQELILFSGESEQRSPDGLMSLRALIESGKAYGETAPEDFDQLGQRVTPGDAATLIYTSGTTGEPKGVLLTHGNITSNVLATYEALGDHPDSDVGLTFLPFSHIFERSNLYGYIHAGVPLYLAESIDTVGENLREIRPTLVTSVPRLFEKIYQKIVVEAAADSVIKAGLIHWALQIGRRFVECTQQKGRVGWGLRFKRWLADLIVFRKWRLRMGGRLRLFVSGGAPLSREIATVFEAAGTPILQGYGLTETSPVITLNPAKENRIGTVGRPIPGTEIRIAEDGEILVRGPGVMSGYYHREEENRLAFEGDWFRTGDLGRLDDDGYLVITDRKKDLIKTSGGKYVAPQPIESRILASRFIRQVVVVGNDRKFPSALVVPDATMLWSYAAVKNLQAGSYRELLDHPRVVNLIERQVEKYTQGLPQFEKIKRVAILRDELTVGGDELTATLKVKRRVVERKYARVIDSLYQEEGVPEALRLSGAN